MLSPGVMLTEAGQRSEPSKDTGGGTTDVSVSSRRLGHSGK